MSRSTTTLVPVLPLGLAVPVPDTRTDEKADRAAIQALWVAFETAVLEKDASAWLSLWDRHGVQVLPSGRVRDYDTLKREEADWSGLTVEAMSILPREIAIVGDHAMTDGRYTLDYRGDGGCPVHVEGTFLSLLSRQPDGAWKICRDHARHAG